MVFALGRPDVDRWYAVSAAVRAHDFPTDPAPSRAETDALLHGQAIGRQRFFAEATGDGTAYAGVCSVRLLDEPTSRHLAEVHLEVAPAERRRGVGTRLLSAAAAAIGDAGRRTLTAEVGVGTPGCAFTEAMGFSRIHAATWLRLDLRKVDPVDLGALADAGPAGYELVRWVGRVPADLAETFAVAKNAMGEMPVSPWNAAAVTEMADVVAARGDDLLTVAVVHAASGAIAGFTEIVVPGGGRQESCAQQYDTLVVPEHRGHRLGLWVKAAMMRWLRTEWPRVAEIEADNAADNRYMLAVNDRLGFQVICCSAEYRAELDDLRRARLGA